MHRWRIINNIMNEIGFLQNSRVTCLKVSWRGNQLNVLALHFLVAGFEWQHSQFPVKPILHSSTQFYTVHSPRSMGIEPLIRPVKKEFLLLVPFFLFKGPPVQPSCTIIEPPVQSGGPAPSTVERRKDPTSRITISNRGRAG